MEITERLNFQLAWKRVKEDFKDMCFFNHPYETLLIESDIDNWLNSLREKIVGGRYNPSRCKIVDVPRPKWHLRPGGVLTIEDNVVYSAVLLDSLEKISEGINWSANTKRFYSILEKKRDGDKWFEFELNGWTKFREESLKLIEGKDNYVLFTDVSAFFENIEIQRLMYDLETLDVPKDDRDMLSRCLNRWAEPRGRGIPQGFRPSNILAEVYLNSIDKRLTNEGIVHLRFVDDVRIFCKTEREAIESMHLLTRLYREKGLNIQIAKSEIKNKSDAINEISGVSKIISGLREEIISELQAGLELESPYSAPAELRALIETKKIKIDLKVLIEAFKKYFLHKEIEFDKSLFHFIINRFGALRNPEAVEYCLELIEKRPEETKFILNYFSNLPNHLNNIAKCLANILMNDSLIYEYQKFLFVKWFWDMRIKTDLVLCVIRNLVKKTSLENTKNYCIAYLGEYGDSTDLDLIETFYTETVNPQLKATIICSLKNMSRSRRNSIYSRARGDGYFVDLAIGWTSSHS